MSTGSDFHLSTVPLSTSFPSAVRCEGGCDGDWPVSPTTSSPSPAAGSRGVTSLLTPSRKNKRKLSEPKKRCAASGIKRQCQSSPAGSAMSESCCSDDGGDDHSVEQRTCCELSQHREESSSSRGPSEEDEAPVLGRVAGLADGSASSFPLLPPGLSSAAACFLPGFYLAADAHTTPLLPQPFPPLPLCFPQPGFSSGREQHDRYCPSVRLDYYKQHNVLTSQTASSHLAEADSPDIQDLSGEEDLASLRGRRPRKNYKNMTRARRVEANARERTRVHTISAAFEALRRAVPCYSYNQKLSKLAILKIASTYIMALARLADVDCSHVSEPSIPVTFADCVELCTRTIQAEGRARRKH